MVKKTIRITLTLVIGGFFLWLAFRNVKIQEVWQYINTMSFGWLLPFAGIMLISNILRAERWRLLIEHDKKNIDGVTLVAGVLTGYLFNLIGPRLGEVTRPVYVAKREELSSSKLIGTVVLERMIDLATMIFLIGVVIVYLITDYSLLRQIFGDATINFLTEGLALSTTVSIIFGCVALLILGFLAIKGIQFLGKRFDKVNHWIEVVIEFFIKFKDGLLSARKVDRWWLFILYTALLWSCYILMTYIPFYMFDMQQVFNLGMLDAVTITVISAIGIAIPSPGGIGTYHYFVTQTLLVIFAVPAVTGLAYATVTHAATVFLVILYTPVALAIDKWLHTKRGVQPA